MKRAYCDIKDQPNYRGDAFKAGLVANGFHVLMRQLPAEPPRPGDVLVLWNRYSDRELTADKWESQGGTVLVAENGYCGRDAKGIQYYAISRHGHNGSGTWPKGGAERWESLGLELKPWRSAGEHVLVCPNRHFGMKGLAMPIDWEQTTLKKLRQHTKRPVRLRPHPNNSAPARPLAADLENCWAVVIWASSTGVHALLAGIPVIATSPWWIVKSAASTRLDEIEAPQQPDRLPAFQRLAWAQWSIEEIASGEPFRQLLSGTGQGEVAQAA